MEMKEDEKLLLSKLKKRTGMKPSAWEIAKSIGMDYKRARYILRDKWTKKGWYGYGVSWRVGWLKGTKEDWLKEDTILVTIRVN